MTSAEQPLSALSPEALYERGMAHYQRRQWRQALEHFERLQQVRPNWPGLDSLIDEARWFLQLEEVETAEGRAIPHEPIARERRLSLRWLIPVLAAVVLVVGVAVWQDWIPGLALRRNLEREALYNRGQASLAVGDYEAARQAFSELARLAPGEPAALEGLERAARLEQLARAYEEAQAAVAAEDWPQAEAKLHQVLAIDPGYADASELLGRVQKQRQLAELFQAGVAAYDGGKLEKAINQLERLIETDPTYRRDAVRELLFILYLARGRALLAQPHPDADRIREAIGLFGRALALRPRNVEATEENRLANQFLSARQAFDRQDWAEARRILSLLLADQPDYADGQAQELLYQTLVRQGDHYRAVGELAAARAAYKQAQALPVDDTSAATAGLQALQALYTPTPTSTPTATPTPRPTPFVEVLVPRLNVRLGPGTSFPIAGQVEAGQRLALIGRNEAGDWLVICCVDDQPGWVAARLVSTTAQVDLLPVGLPPTRVPTATPTATATSTPLPETPISAPPAAQSRPPTPTPLPTNTPTPYPR